jgi:lysophospholipase L1-like esterase
MRLLALIAAASWQMLTAAATNAAAPSSLLHTQGDHSYPSVDGRQVNCPPNFWDTPSGSALRERQLTLGPRFDAGAQLRAQNAPPSPELAAFMQQLADQVTSDWAYRCRYRADNARIMTSGRRPDVVFIGDSITENWPAAHPAFFASGYVGRGVSAQTSSQMVVRFYNDVIALRPRVVHIMAGTNDVNGITGPSTEDDVVNNIKAMLDLAAGNAIKIVLASIPPIDPSPRKPGFVPDTSVLPLNVRLRDLARERGLVYVDYYSALTDGQGQLRSDLSNDGLHPNRAGYDLMEPLTRRAIAEAEEEQGVGTAYP